MFALFFSLYLAMFRGSWQPVTLNGISSVIKDAINAFGEILTSIFNNVNTPMTNLGDVLTQVEYTYTGAPLYLNVVSFILALITSIGIVVVAFKGIKRIFTIFFQGVR